MRIFFAGSSKVSSDYLTTLVTLRFQIVGILTKEAKRRGRGLKLLDPPIKNIANTHGIEVHQPRVLDNSIVEAVKDAGADLGIIVDYGVLIPSNLIDSTAFGWWNIHFSCLPAWRGAAPIHRAILNRDQETGVTIIQIDAGMDSGGILASEKCCISPSDNFTSLRERQCIIGQKLLLSLLQRLVATRTSLSTVPQVGIVSIAAKMTKKDSIIDWHKTAEELYAVVAACVEGPVAHFHHPVYNFEVKIYEAEVVYSEETISFNSGLIKDHKNGGVTVQTGKGCLRLLVAQLPCRPKLPVRDIITGRPYLFEIGMNLSLNN